MRSLIRIRSMVEVPNPGYSEAAKRLSEAGGRPYIVEETERKLQYTSVNIEGDPTVVKVVEDFIRSKYEIE